MSIRERLIERLSTQFTPEHMDVIDDSHLHAGHAGARSGGGHYTVVIVSPAFEGKSAVERHRMVYGALESEMQREIHALALTTRTPAEWARVRSGANS
jgi:BolA family transcriptional regulator, general stress-responsive regulator